MTFQFSSGVGEEGVLEYSSSGQKAERGGKGGKNIGRKGRRRRSGIGKGRGRGERIV